MKLSSLVAAISLAATPALGQPVPGRDAILLPCDNNDTLDQCVDIAKAASAEFNTAVLAIRTTPSGEVAMRFVIGNNVIVVDPKDVTIETYPIPEQPDLPTKAPEPSV